MSAARGNDWLSAAVTRLADEWFRAQCITPWESFALYMRPSEPGRRGDLQITTSAPGDDYAVVRECTLHGGLTRDQAWWRISDAARRLPVLDPQ